MANEATIGQGKPLERLGRYELLGEIASGGMATVFLARVTGAKGFQRLVAIKRLHPHLENEEEFVEMFLDEARLAARIRHPNVVGTLDVEDDEHLYIVMEYVEGDRLLAFLRHAAKTGEKIPPAVVVRLSMDTLAGLHAAHELTDDDGSALGLVHRDVSPQNILVSVDGSVKLVDFGIAKASARLSVTRDGQLKGKIAYMAPEQTKRTEIDRRVDVFAMGIITWEMLTAKKLFNGESDVEVLNQLLFEPIPRLREVAPTVPASLDSVVARALERDPAKRFSTAAEFADALERASKIFGGPAATKTIAAHLQKVSGEKIAKDRARVMAGAPPVPENGATPSGVKRRATGQFSVPSFTNPGATIPPAPVAAPATPPPRKATMVGMGGPPAPPSRPAPPPARPSAPKFDAGPSLLDDDEDVPTSAIVRGDMSASIAAIMGPSGPQSITGQSFNNAIDEEPTTFDGAAIAEPTSAAPASMFAPVASPRAQTQQLPAVRPVVGPPPAAAMPAMAPLSPSAPLTAASAVSIDAPFDAPAPRAEAPKSKTGLILGVAAALFILGGGGTFAAIKMSQANSGATSTPGAIAAPRVNPPAVQPTQPAQPVQPTQPTQPAVGTGTPPPANTQPANGAAPTADPPTNGAAPTQPIANGAQPNTATPPTGTTAATPTAGTTGAAPANPTTTATTTTTTTPTNSATPRTRPRVRRPPGGGNRPGGGGDDLFGGTPY